MARHETLTLTLGLLAFCSGVTVLLVALLLGVAILGAPVEAADLAKSHRLAVPAVVAVVAGVVALNGRRRAWALPAGSVGAAAGVVAVLLAVLLPGAQY